MKLIHDINEEALRKKLSDFVEKEINTELYAQLCKEYRTPAYGGTPGAGYLQINELVTQACAQKRASINAEYIQARFNKVFDAHYNEALEVAIEREARKAAHQNAVKEAKRRIKEITQ